MTGTWPLVRLALRRDRILLPAWIIGLSLMVASSVTATRDLYPTRESLTSAAETINATAALVALYGKVYDPTSLGAISLIKLTAFGAAIVGIIFVFIVIRHTRAEEESGRLELIGAGAVGRAAPLTASLIVSMGASVVLGVLTALGLGAAGLAWGGAFAFGLSWALAGIVFSAIAAVAAQAMTSARAAIGVGVAAVGAAYALRAVGDLGDADPGLLSWLSPVGWSQQIRPFAGDRWWIAAVPIVATAVLVPIAYSLRARRDLGSGLVPERGGPALGTIGGVMGLAWRLQRGLFIAWALGSALMGMVLGSVAHTIAGLLNSPEMAKFFEALGGSQGLTTMFLAAEIGILGSLVGAYAIAAASRLRSEETAGHVELLLSTPATRVRWATSHLAFACVGSAIIIVITGSAIGLAHGLAIGDVGGQVPRLFAASAGQVPAALVIAGIVMLLFGVAPRMVVGAWGLLVAFIVLGEFGSLWQLPQWALDVSPFAHSPRLPGGEVDPGQLALLTGVAAVLIAVGLVAWRRRDLRP